MTNVMNESVVNDVVTVGTMLIAALTTIAYIASLI
jgi:hypothetical protein